MIQIINGFKINSKHPVDSRIIVDDEATRLAILYKYHGLRVWQTDTNTPYFWDGTDWKSELDLVVTGEDGDVTVGNVPVFTSSDPVKIGDSIIRVVGSSTVVIDGNLSFNSISSGSINADLIDTGNMSIDRLTPGSDNQVLRTNSSGIIEWTNLSGLTIGNSTNSNNSNNLKIKTINLSSTYQLVLRNVNSDISGTGGNYIDLFSHVNGLKFKDDGGNGLRILAHNGSSTNPPYSFDSSSNTGMYSPGTNQIGFSTNGQQAVRITSSYINFGLSSTGTPIIKNNSGSVGSPSYTWYSNSNTGMYSPATNEIGFSIAGQQTVRITSSYINFGLSSTGTPIIKNNSGNNSTPSYTWYGDSNTGMYSPATNEIGFSADGNTNLVIGNGFVTFGNNITTGDPRIRTGNNTLPTTPSYTWYGNDQTGIYRPSQDVIGFSTSGVLRLKIENDGTTVNNNFYLPSPNGSTPTAGKILTAFDGTGKSEWSSPSNGVDCGRVYLYNKSNIITYRTGIEGISLSDSYITSFEVPFNGKYLITMVINVHIDLEEGQTAYKDFKIRMARVRGATTTNLVTIRANMTSNDTEVKIVDRFDQTYTLTWAGDLEQYDDIEVRTGVINGNRSSVSIVHFEPVNQNGSHLSWIGIKN